MSENQPLVVSYVDEEHTVLRQRFQKYGYLYFKKAIAADKCNSLLQAFLQQLRPHIAYEEGSGKLLLNGEPFFETDPIWDEVYPKMQSLYDFHNFFHQEDVQRLILYIRRTFQGSS